MSSRASAAGRRGRENEAERYRRVLLDRDRAAELTELLARTWPPRSMVELDGWRLRNGPGLPAHATSAWPRTEGERVPLEVRLDGTHRYYTQAGLSPSVLISEAAQPRGVEAALAQRGWSPRHPAEVRTGPLESLRTVRTAADASVTILDTADRRWLEAWSALTGRGRRAREAAAASLARVEAPTAFVTAWIDDRLAGVARAVIDGGWMGLPDVAVADGDVDVAGTLARAAAGWAAGHEVEDAWCLVADTRRADGAGGDASPAAAETARRAGLRSALRLHVRVAPARAERSSL